MDTKLMVDIATGVMEEIGMMADFGERRTTHFCERLEAAFKEAAAGAPDLRSARTDLSKQLRHIAKMAAVDILHAQKDVMIKAAEEIERLTSAAPVAAAPGGALNDALLRCCSELPEGYAIVVNVERGCGMVTYIDPDGDEFDIEGEGHLSDDVTEAFDACVEDARAIEARIMGGAK